MLNGAKFHLELRSLIFRVLCILKKGRNRDNVSEPRVRLEYGPLTVCIRTFKFFFFSRARIGIDYKQLSDVILVLLMYLQPIQ